jgi:hypothetical protein
MKTEEKKKTWFEKNAINNGSDPVKPWHDKEGKKYLSKLDMLELTNSNNKTSLVMSQVKCLNLEAKELEYQIERIKGKIGYMRSRSKQLNDMVVKELQPKHEDLVDSIGKKYGVDFGKVGYDDETGLIK